MPLSRRLSLLVSLCSVALAVFAPASARPLTTEERIAAQRKIEEVYWRHRIWPAENPGPKPPLSAIVSDETLAARVDDLLRGGHALEALWGRTIGHDEIQAELDRMAHESAAPQVLGEIFHALDDDPYLIAETLVRPSLVERRLRDLYGWDDRFHGGLRAGAAAARAAATRITDLAASGAETLETVVALERTVGPADATLDRDAWDALVRRLADALDVPASGPTDEVLDRLPIGRLGHVVEDADGFRVVTLLERTAGRLKMGTAFWSKTPFDTWWTSARASYPATPEPTADARYRAAAPEASPCTPDTWSAIPGPNVPDMRSEHTAIWTGSEMIVFGGLDGWSVRGDGGRYNPATDTWTPLPSANIPAPRYEHTAVWTGTKMVVWGGLTQFNAAINTGARFDPVANSWQQTTTTGAPSGRNLHTAIWTGTEMIVWGGQDTNVTPQNTGGRYNPTTDAWTATSTGTNVPLARYDHTAVWTGTDMIVWGGFGTTIYNTGGRYRPSTNTWLPTSTGTNVPATRYLHSAVWTGTEMIVWGGGTNNGTGGRYNPTTDTWLTVTTTGAPSGRGSLTAIWTGTEMIIWGGYGPATNTGGRYRPDLDSWTPTSTGVGCPSARYWHTAVWTGSQMIVWGGQDPSVRFRTGGKYDPATDSWTPTSTGGDAPSPRWNAKAVWTGAEMVVFGGTNQGTRLGTGARYDAATSTWTALPRNPADLATPAPREQHTMVWTGTEVVIWGGWTHTVYLSGGSRFNPGTNTWAAMAATNAPLPRGEHTAVWDGTEMIVWGGYGGSFQNTGGRYRPATDTWLATSTGANVPTARQYHVAVWNGSRMIVWGGAIFGGVTNTGGVYDPVADTWLPTSTGANVPTARQWCGGAWTGSRLVVWGGRDGSSSTLATGGKYDPTTDSWAPVNAAPSGQFQHSTVWTGTHMIPWGGFPGQINTGWLYEPAGDSWTPTSTVAPVPSGRVGHVAVWTGTEMIVWGGLAANNQYASDGGRYCPLSCPTWYRDADGDGHGAAAVSQIACSQPGGFVASSDDCNDADAAVWTRAPELDGLLAAADKITFTWNPGPFAVYDILRGVLSELPVGAGASETCLAVAINASFVQDVETPVPDQGFWYLVRTRNSCGGGPYGYRTGGIEEIGTACP